MANPLIQVSDLGSWEYYIMSDNTAVWRAMNGLASWFSGSGGMIQNAAWMGALMLLFLTLFSASIGKTNGGSAQLGAWFLFMTMMGATGTANIINVYTGQITQVANVPALVLIPASMFSKASNKVFVSMETAFQATTGSYMSVTQNAFVGPLDVLLALRSPKLSSAIPALNQTLVQVVHDCGDDPQALPANAPPVSKNNAPDILKWFVDYGRKDSMTTVYTDTDTTGAGSIYSCGDAFIYLNAQYAALANGNSTLTSFINSETSKFNPQNSAGTWGGSSVVDSYGFVVGAATGMQQSALEFTKNSLTAATIDYTLGCMRSAGMLTTADNCAAGAMASADQRERWKTDAAMNGSSFLKTMFTSMGFLQVMFFALFPFIALYGLIVVNKTLTVFGSYVLFGIWSQSFLLVVAPIQSFIQTSVIDEMTKITSTSHAVTLSNMASVYEALSNKLALASDLMANSQMLSLALLSGSIVAMSGMVGKWSGSQHLDAGSLQQKVSESAPIIKNNPMISASSIATKGGGSLMSQDSVGATPFQLSTSWNQITSTGSTRGLTATETKARAQALSKELSKAVGFNVSEEQAAQLLNSYDAVQGATARVSAGIAKDLLSAMRGPGAAKLTAQQEAASLQNIQSAQGAAITSLAAKDKGFMAKLFSDNEDEKVQAWTQVANGAITALSVGALGVEMLSGAGAVAAPATIAARGAAMAAAPSMVRGLISSRAKQPGAVAENKAGRFVSGLKDGIGAIGEAVAGNVNAALTADFKHSMKDVVSSSAKKGTTWNEASAAKALDSITRTHAAAITDGYTQSASQGVTNIVTATLNNEQLNAIATNGNGTKSGEQFRKDAAQTMAQIRSGDIRKSNGERFSKEEIAQADNAVAQMLQGHKTTSNDPNVSAADVDRFKYAALFENLLTKSSNGTFGSGSGLASGAFLPGKPNTNTTAAKPAVAATQGHWERVPTEGQKNAPEEQPFTLAQWATQFGSGDDPTSDKAKQAEKAGLRWVPGKPAQAAVPEITTLNQDQAEGNKNISLKNVSSGNLGGGNEKALASVDTGKDSVKFEQKFKGAKTVQEALARLSPDERKEFDGYSDDTKDKIKLAAGVQAIAGVVSAVASKPPSVPTSTSTPKTAPTSGAGKTKVPASTGTPTTSKIASNVQPAAPIPQNPNSAKPQPNTSSQNVLNARANAQNNNAQVHPNARDTTPAPDIKLTDPTPRVKRGDLALTNPEPRAKRDQNKSTTTEQGNAGASATTTAGQQGNNGAAGVQGKTGSKGKDAKVTPKNTGDQVINTANNSVIDTLTDRKAR